MANSHRGRGTGIGVQLVGFLHCGSVAKQLGLRGGGGIIHKNRDDKTIAEQVPARAVVVLPSDVARARVVSRSKAAELPENVVLFRTAVPQNRQLDLGKASMLAVTGRSDGAARDVALQLDGVVRREVAGRAGCKGRGHRAHDRQTDSTPQRCAENLTVNRMGQAYVRGQERDAARARLRKKSDTLRDGRLRIEMKEVAPGDHMICTSTST